MGEEVKVIFFVIVSIISVVFSIINKKAKEAEKQKKNIINKIDFDDIPAAVTPPVSARRKKPNTIAKTPTSQSTTTEPLPSGDIQPKREYSEKEKMIIYSEIMKPKFDE